MIKIFINEIEYTQYFANGFSILENLDEELDSSGITLFNTNIENEFIPQSTVKIYKDDVLVKSLLISNDRVILSSKRPIRYTHEIELIETTKKLERFFIDGKKFTQPLEEDVRDPYTLLDVVMYLRASIPMRHSSEVTNTGTSSKPYYETLKQIIFEIPEETKLELDSVIAPEFNFKEKTLRECLDEVASYIDCNVYLDAEDNLMLNKFNQLNEMVSHDNFIDKVLERNIDYYASNLENNVMNAVGEFDEGDVNVEFYPSKDVFINGRSNDFVWDYIQTFLPTTNPIYKVKQVVFKVKYLFREFIEGVEEQNWTVLGDFFVKDTIFEKEKARELPVASSRNQARDTEQNFSNTSLTYKFGSKNIDLPLLEGVFNDGQSLLYVFYREEIENLIRIAEDYTGIDRENAHDIIVHDLGIYYYTTPTYYLSVVGGYGTSGDIEANLFAARVEYIPLKATIRMNIERDNISETPYKSYLQSNQQLRIVDIDRYANKAKAKLNRLGLTEMMLTERVKTLDQALNLGDFTTNKFIITRRELIFYKDFIVCKYALHKSFNRSNRFVGLDQMERQWEIGESGRTIERNINYDEYVEFDLLDVSTANKVSSLTLENTARNKILNTLNPNQVDNIPLTLMTVTGKQTIDSHGISYVNPELVLGFTKHVGGNQILLHTSIDSNYSVGERIERTDRWSVFGAFGAKRFEQRPTIFADEFGRGDLFKFKFYDIAPTPTVLEIESDKSFDDYVDDSFDAPILKDDLLIQNDKRIEAELAIFKDSGEKINLGISYHFVPISNELIIGNKMTKKSLLINKNVNSDLKIRKYNDVWFTTRDKENVNHYDVYTEEDLTVTINESDGLIEVTNDLFNFDSYAIVDSLGNSFLLVNNVKNLISISFVRDRTGMFYKEIPTELIELMTSAVGSSTLDFVAAINKVIELTAISNGISTLGWATALDQVIELESKGIGSSTLDYGLALNVAVELKGNGIGIGSLEYSVAADMNVDLSAKAIGGSTLNYEQDLPQTATPTIVSASREYFESFDTSSINAELKNNDDVTADIKFGTSSGVNDGTEQNVEAGVTATISYTTAGNPSSLYAKAIADGKDLSDFDVWQF